MILKSFNVYLSNFFKIFKLVYIHFTSLLYISSDDYDYHSIVMLLFYSLKNNSRLAKCLINKNADITLNMLGHLKKGHAMELGYQHKILGGFSYVRKFELVKLIEI
ncbi:hypothetical protein BpHYR1_001456 [Brachionus plicatilis]|uniref:Uncharacterized protein n=1 Tax=Brachionus plicatilis TaxID=10195 RepID=A0A3M7T4J2_BRAPC|nr:hypothetical protein BpHYR1_001456 [Brachionus plicatilis]